MNKDGHFTHLHLLHPHHANFFEDICKKPLPADEIYVPPQYQPINPEDEDDVVPDQHAAFGIAKATQRKRQAAWKDFGLTELLGRGPRGLGGLSGSKRALPR